MIWNVIYLMLFTCTADDHLRLEWQEVCRLPVTTLCNACNGNSAWLSNLITSKLLRQDKKPQLPSLSWIRNRFQAQASRTRLLKRQSFNISGWFNASTWDKNPPQYRCFIMMNLIIWNLWLYFQYISEYDYLTNALFECLKIPCFLHYQENSLVIMHCQNVKNLQKQ